jgi:SAM-dependent methyltransferase
MAEASRYIHGTGAEEQRRLSELNRLLNEACVRELSPARGARVLDVGAGLGQLSRAIARSTGAPVVGVERSGAQIEEARRLASADGEEGLLDLRQGDAFELPLRPEEWGSFDVVHARFLLEHVPTPERVLAQMVRAVRPGGRVVVCDDDHSVMRLHPEPPGFAAAWEAFVRSYDRLGNDPFVGRRLVALLHGAGARPRRATWIFFGACAGDPAFPGFAENLAGNLRGARDAIAATGMVSADALERTLAALTEFGERPDAAIWYAMPWAEGVRAGQ